MKKIHNKITNSIMVILLVISIFGFVQLPVRADDTINSSSFSVKAVIPENQIDEKLSYFDLLMTPKQKQTIQIVITNASKETIIANTKVNAASTGTNGTIIYNEQGIKDETLVNTIEDIAIVKQPVVTIEPESSINVDIELAMPDDLFDGVILGGIVVTSEPKDAGTDDTTVKDGFKIENKIAYAIGLKLSQTDTKVNPNINLKSIKPMNIALRTAMAINIQNSEAIIMKNVKIDAQIYEKGSDKVLHSAITEVAEIAPNTNFDFTVDWENQRIVPGVYRLKMRIDYGDKYWEWDEEFEVKADDSDVVNKEAINLENSSSIWIFIVIGGLVIMLIIYIAFILGKRSKKQDDEK